MFLLDFSVQSVIKNPNSLLIDKEKAEWILRQIEKGSTFVEDDNIQEYVEYCWEDEEEEVSLSDIKEHLIKTSYQIEFCGDWYWFFPEEGIENIKIPFFMKQ